jgi:hypothetical protein
VPVPGPVPAPAPRYWRGSAGKPSDFPQVAYPCAELAVSAVRCHAALVLVVLPVVFKYRISKIQKYMLWDISLFSKKYEIFILSHVSALGVNNYTTKQYKQMILFSLSNLLNLWQS